MRNMIRTVILIGCISLPVLAQENQSLALNGVVLGENGAAV